MERFASARNLKVDISRVAGIFRSIAASVGTGPTAKKISVFGWGVNTSVGLKTFGKDQSHICCRGRTRNFPLYPGHFRTGYRCRGPPRESHPHLEATPAVEVEAAYQHYWFKKLRSSAIYSYAGGEQYGPRVHYHL